MRLMRPRPERADRGETLIEALITIGILGVAVVALLGSLLLGVRTSVQHRKAAQAQAELRSWAERISRDPYDRCARPGNFAGPGSLPSGLSGSVGLVKYWDPTAAQFTTAPCRLDRGLQKVTLRITVADGIAPGFTRSLDVVVRQP